MAYIGDAGQISIAISSYAGYMKHERIKHL